jgi:hypothetical protein
MPWVAAAGLASAALGAYSAYKSSQSSGGTNSPTSVTTSNSSQQSRYDPSTAESPLYGWLYGNANQLAQQAVPYYPGQTYVSPSDLTQQGVQNQQYGLNAANQNYLGLSRAADVANNPYVQGMLGANANSVNQQLKESWLPAIQGNAISSGSGGIGSSRAGLAQSQAVERAANQLSNTNANTLLNSYGQGLTAQSNALGQTGAMLGNQLLPGQTVEGYQNQALQDQIARFNYGYTEPWTRMQNTQSLLQGSPLGTSYGTTAQTGTSPNAAYKSPYEAAVGGASTGLGLLNAYQNYQKGQTANTNIVPVSANAGSGALLGSGSSAGGLYGTGGLYNNLYGSGYSSSSNNSLFG